MFGNTNVDMTKRRIKHRHGFLEMFITNTKKSIQLKRDTKDLAEVVRNSELRVLSKYYMVFKKLDR